HVGPGLGLPPGVDDRRRGLLGRIARAVVGADDLAVPPPGLRVDGLTHGAQHTNAGEVVLIGELPAPLHAGADQRGCGVELGDPVLLNDLPQPALVRGVRGALVHDLGGPVGHGPVGDVAVAGDPADVCGAPVDVLVGLHVVVVTVGDRSLGQIAAGGVQDALRVYGGAGGVAEEQRVLSIVGHVGVLRGLLG